MSDQTKNLCTEELVESIEIEYDEFSIEEEPSLDQVDAKEAESALVALKPILLAIPQSQVRSLRVGVTTVVGIGLSYAEAFSEDLPLFEQSFKPEAFDPSEYDDLAERAKAYWQADILMRQEMNTDVPLRPLIARAKPLRAKMKRAAIYLWSEDADLGNVVAAIRRGHGYADIADDLASLATLFTEHWNEAVDKCDVELDEIELAKQLGTEILQLISPSRIETLNEVRDLRHRAAEHLRCGIDEVRAAAKYIFRDDPKAIGRYPSLFVQDKKKSSKNKSDAEATSGSTATMPSTAAASCQPSTTIATQSS